MLRRMMSMCYVLFLASLSCGASPDGFPSGEVAQVGIAITAQSQEVPTEKDARGRILLFGQDPAWYAGKEAVRIADNMLAYQRNNGGFPERWPGIDYTLVLSEKQKADIRAENKRTDSSLDNGSTHTQLRYLAKVATATGEDRFKAAFIKGVDYLLAAQQPSGGWMQSWPHALYGSYASNITFNDGAMIGAMTVLQNVARKKADYVFVDETRRKKAAEAVARGIDCILKCQIVVDGTPTVWCQQHDVKTLQPRGARSFEPPALCSWESIGIVQFLMQIDNPDPEVIAAIQNAVAWYEKVKIVGKQIVKKRSQDGRTLDCVIVNNPDVPPQWARFYNNGKLNPWPLGVAEIKLNQPIFIDTHPQRGFDGHGKVYDTLAAISLERRKGYNWMGPYANDLLNKDYPAWQKKWAPDRNVLLEATARAALEEAIPRAAKDTTRPMYHYRPPARWMNDICGAIYYNGYHHIFYQSNPYQDDEYGWGWGHARSKDLVHWEELPFPLMPMGHRGERRCNSGCVTLDSNGMPMIFYTFVPQTAPNRSQWGLVSLDDELIHWRRVSSEPLMEIGKNGVPANVSRGWSDPYVFKKDGRTFVTFKACGGLVCEAQNETLTEWNYIGRLEGVTGECPNVFKLQDKWVIIRSTSPISYVTGDLVLEGNEIRYNQDGLARTLDHGYGKNRPSGRSRHCRGLYGTNTYVDSRGRRIMFGWISGFKTGRGWNGCMSLPRLLTFGHRGELIQTPGPELKQLRGRHTHVDEIAISNTFKRIDGAEGKQLELFAEFVPGDAKAFGLKLRSSGDGSRAITLAYSGGILNVAGTEVPIENCKEYKSLTLHVFLDNSVMEVFINGGRQAVTRVEYPGEDDQSIGIFAEGGSATLKSLDAWQIKNVYEGRIP